MSQTYESFGKYILLEKLAMGGMAEIYLARSSGASGVSKFFAVKRILPQFTEQTEFIDMFKDEAKIAVNLSHANVVSIYEFGIEKEAFFLAMDYIEGRNLRQILNKMKKSSVTFTIEQVLYIIKEVAAGLDHAHRCIDAQTGKPLNIIHRDMSPQNVMISFEGEVKIVDFGIAKAETQLETTRAGTLKGKFGYMSPEQAEGQAVDLRTDVFALGIVLWELLANDRLFVAKNEVDTLRKIRDCQVPSLRKINPHIAPELERIVSKALAKDRNLRYQTSAAFHRELSRFLNRQYPDFSPQDFSVFIKTLFAQEIMDSRKKMVEYAKIEVKEVTSSTSSHLDKTVITQTTGVFEQGDPSFGNAKLSAMQPALQPTNHSALRPAANSYGGPGNSASNAGSGNSGRGNPTAPDTPPRRSGQTYNPHAPTQVREASVVNTYATRSVTRTGEGTLGQAVSMMSILVIVGCVLGGGAYYYVNPSGAVAKASGFLAKIGVIHVGEGPSTSPEPVAPTKQKKTFDLTITSTPSGAPVVIDGVPTHEVTPATISIERGKKINLSIQLAGYFRFEQSIQMNDNQAINAQLKAERKGFVNVIVRGEGQIFVNDKYITDRSPALLVAVPAGEQVKVVAYDPTTKAIDEQLVTVDEGEKKDIQLQPRLPAGNSTSPKK